jgi:hypothetical protein
VFDLPARQGERYDDTAPDTLDLAAMAELANKNWLLSLLVTH